MVTLATILLIVNGLFLFLGGLLSVAESNGLNLKGDDLFPTIALGGTLECFSGYHFYHWSDLNFVS